MNEKWYIPPVPANRVSLLKRMSSGFQPQSVCIYCFKEASRTCKSLKMFKAGQSEKSIEEDQFQWDVPSDAVVALKYSLLAICIEIFFKLRYRQYWLDRLKIAIGSIWWISIHEFFIIWRRDCMIRYYTIKHTLKLLNFWKQLFWEAV